MLFSEGNFKWRSGNILISFLPSGTLLLFAHIGSPLGETGNSTARPSVQPEHLGQSPRRKETGHRHLTEQRYCRINQEDDRKLKTGRERSRGDPQTSDTLPAA